MQRSTAREASIALDGAGGYLSVRGHRGIMEYGGSTLRLRLPEGALLIEGEGLQLESMDGEDISIVGRIDSVRLLR